LRPVNLPVWSKNSKRLAYISGSVDQELLLQNEYLVTEIWILIWKDGIGP
jgi:hypothetical protein